MHARLAYSAVVSSIFFCVCSVAHAANTTWDFRDGMPSEAGVHNLTTSNITPEGLHIKTDSEGYISWPGQPLTGSVDVVTIRARAAFPTEAAWMWQPIGSPEGDFVQVFIAFEASENMMNIDVPLNYYDQWDHHTNALGIAFPAGSDVIIEQIIFHQSGIGEKIIEAVKSFWVFDDFYAYSINFLWGPLISTSAAERAELFIKFPPLAWSAMRVVYGVIAISMMVAGILFWRRRSTRPMTIILGTFAACWIVLGIRMDAELITYATDDLRDYVFASEDDKQFRMMERLHANVDAAMPIILEHERMAILAEPRTATPGYVRYMSYPTVAIFEGMPTDDVTLWFVYGRPDVRVNEQGQLEKTADVGATILSEPGKIVQQFDSESFLFSTTP